MLKDKLLKNVIYLGVGGSALYILGLFGYIKPISTIGIGLLTFSPIITLWKTIGHTVSRMKRVERLVIITNCIILILYAGGIFVPEVSYDALWYHLPEAQVYANTGLIRKIPKLLYSTMPRLGEMFFIFGFTIRSPIAVKAISFYGLLLYLGLSYLLARRFLPRPYALITTLSVTSIFVLSWLGTSGYIDLFRAIFELASLYCMFKFLDIKPIFRFSDNRMLLFSALFAGFALSVKFHALIHLFAFTLVLIAGLIQIQVSKKRLLLLVSGFWFLVTVLASPWYIDNYLQSGHPLYPTNLPQKQLDQLTHAGASSMPEWLTSQTLKLPLIFWHLTVSPTDVLTPLFLILLPIVIWRIKFLVTDHTLYALSYTLLYLISWWYLPPPETRYLVTLFPLFLILGFKAVHSLPKKHAAIKQLAFIFTAISIFITVSFRLYASKKWLPLFTGHLTRDQYIQSQTTDFNREIVEKYYSGYWGKYQYSRE